MARAKQEQGKLSTKASQVATSEVSSGNRLAKIVGANPSNQDLLRRPDVQVRIRERAYQLFVARGYQHGNHNEDWCAAERQVLNELSRSRS